MSEVDRLVSDVVADVIAEETSVATEENMITVPDEGREIDNTPSDERDFGLRHLGGQELSEEDNLKLKEFSISCGYQPGSLLFGGVDEEILGCICDRAGAKIVLDSQLCIRLGTTLESLHLLLRWYFSSAFP
jgi:hypothetical protein